MNPDHIAQAAQLAMLIELSSNPKPGNVDRGHDYDDIGFHHFLVSAVSAYPVFRKAASGNGSQGELILDAVSSWSRWHLEDNTHFGSLTLLMPLSEAAGKTGDLRGALRQVLNDTTVEDAVNFYAAFDLAGARVADVADLSLKDPRSAEKVRQSGETLLDLMRRSQDHDMVAREWANGFERSFRLSDVLTYKVKMHGLNDGVVLTYLETLAEEPDSLVRSKFGREKAEEVSRRAGAAIGHGVEETLRRAEELDRALIEEDVNPGSSADLIAAALFIALVKGMKF